MMCVVVESFGDRGVSARQVRFEKLKTERIHQLMCVASGLEKAERGGELLVSNNYYRYQKQM